MDPYMSVFFAGLNEALDLGLLSKDSLRLINPYQVGGEVPAVLPAASELAMAECA